MNEICKEYIIYMFSENDCGLLFQKFDYLDEAYLISYLTEENWTYNNEEEKYLIKSYSIKVWYKLNHPNDKLFTDC